MENLVLAHLQEPLCEDPADLEKLSDSDEGGESLTRIFERVGHVREIRRWDFVPNKVQRALAIEENGNSPAWRLIERNQARVDGGLWPVTYVKRVEETEVPEDYFDRGPIQFRSKVIMAKLQQDLTS